MYTILLVDDSRVMRQLVRRTVCDAGFSDSTFLEATNGQEALAVLRDRDWAIDIVLCDRYMPTMGGMEFLQALGAQDRLGSCPVIIVTSDAENKDVLDAGARDLVTKPFTAQTLGKAVRDVLGVNESDA